MLLGDVHHHAHLLRSQHGAGGVAGVGDHDGPGVLVDLRLHLGPVGIVIAVMGRGGNGMDGGAAGIGHGVVVGIEGLGDQDLIAVIQDAVHGDLQCLAAAVGDQDIALFKVHPQIIVILLDGIDQNGDAGRRRILQHRQVKMTHCLKIRLGRLNIRLADIQMIDLFAFCLCRHCIRVKLTHRGQAAFQNLTGKFHEHSSFYELSAERTLFCADTTYQWCPHTNPFFSNRQDKMRKTTAQRTVVFSVKQLFAPVCFSSSACGG